VLPETSAGITTAVKTGRIPWSELYAARREAEARFGTLFRLPVRPRILRVAAGVIEPGTSVLDVGAGDRRAGDRLAALVPGVVYRSMDPDPRGAHDFADLAEAPHDFDAALLLEVLEHLELEDGLELLREIREHVKPGGWLVVSTPNVAHPRAYLRDATHRTPYAHDELAGVLSWPASGSSSSSACITPPGSRAGSDAGF
jgi:SAM-dependent methyltransferase